MLLSWQSVIKIDIINGLPFSKVKIITHTILLCILILITEKNKFLFLFINPNTYIIFNFLKIIFNSFYKLIMY